ncbi:potassium transporter 5-like isoform X1 [Amaranthus tricolor]|uniref:potassium transporter 5-like isoform X1 n=1 Tax=Amaranthus tricolor TaxID=29722 RepID=UPI00258304B8|nr:potassium transporter 5-like isoform X1 [Amaranthus tricolor]
MPKDEQKPEGIEEPKLRRHDSLDLESSNVKGHHGHSNTDNLSWTAVLSLAFQSIGVIYGDIGTSPLYVYESTFSKGIKSKDDILGVLSLIFYTITLLPLIKYVFIVLRANDNGKGGTFALYSLLCRNTKVGLLPSQQAEDQEVSNYQLELPTKCNQLAISLKLKNFLEKSLISKYTFLLVTLLSTSLVIGDGVLTPSISVLSAVGGLKAASPVFTEGRVVWISVAILVLLFSVQRFGTDKVGYCFAPIVSVWFAFNAGIGVYNFIKYDPTVIKALNPGYIIDYFKRNGIDAWISLGGVFLCVTGTEALFADLGHFSVKSIQLSMSGIVYPALMATYFGQASFLRLNQDKVGNTFYEVIPGPLYWPVFVSAVLASIVASQAMISGTFSIIQQSLALGCFPRVKVVHTSLKYEGQVYIPELNYILMLACVVVTFGFRTTEKIGNAYGVAVAFAETITSSFMVLVMILIWKLNIILPIIYVCCILSVELTYLSSVFYKFPHGGYFPIAFAIVLLGLMFIWNYVYRKKYYYEMDHKVSPDALRNITSRSNLSRISGLAIFYSELVHGIPPILEHYVENIPALHSVLVFVSVKSLPISTVPPQERFLFRRVQPRDAYVFRCVVRYGYTDSRNDEESFEQILMHRLKEFMKDEFYIQLSNTQLTQNPQSAIEWSGELVSDNVHQNDDEAETIMCRANQEALDRELGAIDKAWNEGVVHLMGETELVSHKGASICNKFVIVAFNFLKKNLRQADKVFHIPRKHLLKVGMIYEL